MNDSTKYYLILSSFVDHCCCWTWLNVIWTNLLRVHYAMWIKILQKCFLGCPLRVSLVPSDEVCNMTIIWYMSHLMSGINWRKVLWKIQSNWNQISHLLPFTDMSHHGRSEEILLRVTCKWPYVSSNENNDCKTMKVLLSWFAWYEQFDWLKKSLPYWSYHSLTFDL